MSIYTDPVEEAVAQALGACSIKFTRNVPNPLGEGTIDFYLDQYKLYIECKRMYTERVMKQMQGCTNIIVIQGLEAAMIFGMLLKHTGVQHA